MSRLFRVSVPKFEEVRHRVLQLSRKPIALPKSVKKRGMVKYLERIKSIYTYLDSAIFSLPAKLPRSGELHPFYRELLKAASIESYDDIVGKLAGFRRVLRNLTLRYSLRVKESLDVNESRKLFREYVGRALSIVRRTREDLEMLARAISELRRMPCINLNELKVVVAGMPQVGKSTFVKSVSSANPKISPFPFTTREIIVGHTLISGRRVQVIDTPGILDRPPEMLNNVELRALAALRYLADAVVFLIDPSRDSYYSLEQQLNLLKNVLEHFRQGRVLVAINKVDRVDNLRLSEVLRAVARLFKGDIMVMSALKGINTVEVLKRATDLAHC